MANCTTRSQLKILFLDIDGVLNNHWRYENGYCGIQDPPVACLNQILDTVKDLKIVISSAWRYLILRKEMNLKGFECLLLVHGIKCEGQLLGYTGSDPKVLPFPDHDNKAEWDRLGKKWRVQQIQSAIKFHKPDRFAVVDDLPLKIDNFVQTDGEIGLSQEETDEIIKILQSRRRVTKPARPSRSRNE